MAGCSLPISHGTQGLRKAEGTHVRAGIRRRKCAMGKASIGQKAPASEGAEPEWFGADDSKIYESATAGSSPFNQWYEFDNRAEAIDLISKVFDSQSFVDRFTYAQGEYYYSDQLFPLLAEQFGEDHDFSEVTENADLSSLSTADLSAMIEAESRF